MKKINLIFCAFVIISILTSFYISVHAEDIGSTSSSQNNLSQTEEMSFNQDVLDEEDYKSKFEESLAINEELLGVYDTWTSIISIVLILVTLFGIIVPIYTNIRIDKKIKNAIKKLKNENGKTMEKHLSINNALMLSASKDYWSSNEILKDILKEDKENTYLHLLIGRNFFLQYVGDDAPQMLNDEQVQDIEEAIKHYLFVANHSKTEEKYYTLGVVFPNSIIHELCMLTNKLIEFSIQHKQSNYHKLAASV